MKLMQLGMTGVNINSTIDADTAKLLASEFGYEVENVAVSDDALVAEARGAFDASESARTSRAPVVTVMGHVDHGKTSLLDKIRNANVAAGEAGGITQHLGAYRVETSRGPLVFLDTPGHAAFTAMRARGAQATDVVILVVAADDGVMPQTKEAVAHAQDAKVPIVVAINKMDRDDARPDVVMRELANMGLQPEDWGGDTIFVQVSALTGMGIDKLLDSVALQAEVLELSAAHDAPAVGVVLEAYLDKGRGPVASLLVKNGTLKTGGIVVAGSAFGRVRAMSDDRGKAILEAGPSTPVEVLGLSAVPEAGDQFLVVTDAKIAQALAERRKKPASRLPATTTAKVGLDQLFQKLQEGDVRELRLVIKSDMQGSAEALVKALLELSTDKVKVNVIHSGAGAITENDVMLAAASRAIIIGFHVRSSGGAAKIAKSERVEIRLYTIIYEAVDEVRKAMTGLLKPEFVERPLGRAEVREVFTIPKIGAVAGSMVLDGKIQRGAKARLVRDGVQVWEGTIRSIRRFKEDVKEVGTGVECGIGLENFNDVKPQDVVECFELEQIAVTL
jgi:translation initiation factor IF-2